MEEQNQGWSTTAKVTAAIAAVGAAAFGISEIAERFGETAVATAQAGIGADVADSLVEKTTDNLEKLGAATTDAAKDGIAAAGATVDSAKQAIGDFADKAKPVIDNAVEKTGELTDTTVAKAGELAEQGKGIIADNPYKSVAAATALVGTAAYIKGRSDGARKVEQGQAYA